MSRRYISRRHAFLLVVWIYGASLLCLAAQQTGSFAGKVSGAQGQALHGATVTLSRAEDGLKLSIASTGSDGIYRLTSIGYGRYRLSAAMAGYQDSVTETITLSGDVVAVDFSLQAGDSSAGGFVENENDRLTFRASGVEGSTAPSGYSAAASVEDATAVMARVSRMEEAGVFLEPSAAKVPDCNREGDLINAAHSHPGSFDFNHQLGVFYFEHGDIKQSVEYLERASAIEPYDMDNARWLALAYLRTNQSSKAVAGMQSLVRQHPGEPAPLLYLAQIYEATGDRQRAIPQYVSAAKLNMGAENLFACGIGLVSLGAVEEALPLFTAATSRDPGSARLWMGLGIAQSLSNRRVESARSLLRAADLDPGYFPTWFFLAALPGAPTATDDEIRRRLAVLVASNSGSAEAHYDYALALGKHWKQNPSPQLKAQIEAQLRLAIGRDPAFPAAHFQLGTVYEQAGDYAQAASELEQAVRLDPDNAAARYRLAQAYQRTHRAALADRELAKFKSMRSEQPQENETTEAGLRAYTAQLTRPQRRSDPCR